MSLKRYLAMKAVWFKYFRLRDNSVKGKRKVFIDYRLEQADESPDSAQLLVAGQICLVL